jgi:hypothetical protein
MAETKKPRPIGELVDELGRVRAHIAGLEKIEKAIADELKGRGVPEAEGAVYRMTVVSAVRWSLDSAAVKREMGAAWWDERCRQGVTVSVRVAPRADALLQAAA